MKKAKKDEKRTKRPPPPAKPSSSSSWPRVCLIVTAFLAGAVAIVVFIPGPIDAIPIKLHPYEDRQDNAYLRAAIRMFEGEFVGPEAFAIDVDGNIYTGLVDGRIIRFNDTSYTTIIRIGSPPYDKCGLESQLQKCGRPLGLEFDPLNPNLLYIAEAYHGIYQYNLETEELKLLINSSILPSSFPEMKFVNDLVVLKNGSIFFDHSSSRFHVSEVLREVNEGRATGNLIHYNPLDGSLSIVVSGLTFANGVYKSKNEDFLLIAETTTCTVRKYYLQGPRAGENEPFIKGLPGLPDNISPSSSGGLWVSFAISRRTGMYDMMSGLPWARNLISKLGLEKIIMPLLPNDGMIVEYNEKGERVRGLYDPGAKNIFGVSEVLDTGSKLYLGSFNAPYVARLDL